MKLVLADIEAAALDKAVADLPEGTEVEAVVCDVSDGSQVEALRDAAVARFGTAHVVCNNAGVSTAGPIWKATLEDWDWLLGVNLYGVINGIRAFTPLFIEQGEGHIVNTASMAGLVSAPSMGVYNVSKHGVVTMSETLFADLALAGAPGVGVSVLCPGWVDTRIHESHRNRAGQESRDPTAEEAAVLDFIGSLLSSGLDPTDVAAMVVDAVRQRRFYVLTHPDWTPMISNRVSHIVDGTDPIIASLPT
jgi:NAD(P)-dependent dehydrogenase (short-subunit alcohol dehydrogenase family)